MDNELDSLDFHIVKCMNCGSLDEVWNKSDDPHICADCEGANYFCPDCHEVGYDCTCYYCQYCSHMEEDCDCQTCSDCGMIVYECGCEEDYPWVKSRNDIDGGGFSLVGKGSDPEAKIDVQKLRRNRAKKE